MHLKAYLVKFLVVVTFLLMSSYILFIETEKYESTVVVAIKDLSQEQSVSSFGSLLLSAGSESNQDASLIELYIKSGDMFTLLDRDFNLTAYYSGKDIDVLNRLSNNSLLSMFEVNQKNLIKKYNNDLRIIYDDPSATLEISYAHANPEVAKQIVDRIIYYATRVLNQFDRENSQVVLSFLEKEEEEKYQKFLISIEALLKYQNQHNTIDPKVDVEAKSAILATLEAEVVQKNVEYNSKLQYMNQNTAEMKILTSHINNLNKNIEKIKNQIVGNQKTKELNSNVSDFGLLESKVEFNKQLYVHTLTKLEEVKMLISQNTKNLITVSQSFVADSYSYPEKSNNIFSLLIIFSFIYGILILVIGIIKDHKD